jgi:hypothetical protein
MSVDINWETLTTGPDGAQLAESIRTFIHDKFQQIPLPQFIRAVQVHSFDFGNVGPEIQLKDICDPLPDFYEDDDGDNDNPSEGSPMESPSPPALGYAVRLIRQLRLNVRTTSTRGLQGFETALGRYSSLERQHFRFLSRRAFPEGLRI